MSSRIGIILAAAIAPAFCQSFLPGSAQGVVLSLNGTPVAQATVSFKRVPRHVRQSGKLVLARGEVRYQATATTQKDGAYRLDGLPPGTYLVCASTANLSYVDFCEWNYTPEVVLTPATISLVPPIRMQAAVQVTLTLADPSGLAKPSMPTASAANLVVGFLDPSSPSPNFHGFRSVTPALPKIVYTPYDAKGKNYGELVPAPGQDWTVREYRMETIVPADATLRLWIHAPGLQIGDQSNLPVSNTGAGPVIQARSGGGKIDISLRVVGRTP